MDNREILPNTLELESQRQLRAQAATREGEREEQKPEHGGEPDAIAQAARTVADMAADSIEIEKPAREVLPNSLDPEAKPEGGNWFEKAGKKIAGAAESAWNFVRELYGNPKGFEDFTPEEQDRYRRHFWERLAYANPEKYGAVAGHMVSQIDQRSENARNRAAQEKMLADRLAAEKEKADAAVEKPEWKLYTQQMSENRMQMSQLNTLRRTAYREGNMEDYNYASKAFGELEAENNRIKAILKKEGHPVYKDWERKGAEVPGAEVPEAEVPGAEVPGAKPKIGLTTFKQADLDKIFKEKGLRGSLLWLRQQGLLEGDPVYKAYKGFFEQADAAKDKALDRQAKANTAKAAANTANAAAVALEQAKAKAAVASGENQAIVNFLMKNKPWTPQNAIEFAELAKSYNAANPKNFVEFGIDLLTGGSKTKYNAAIEKYRTIFAKDLREKEKGKAEEF